jgi:hypothetical protein
MTNKRIELLNNIARMKDGVLLLFDDSDSAIARNWRNAMQPVAATEKRL